MSVRNVNEPPAGFVTQVPGSISGLLLIAIAANGEQIDVLDGPPAAPVVIHPVRISTAGI